MKYKRCQRCSSPLVSLYCREGKGGKEWIKIQEKYCKKCEKVKEKGKWVKKE